MSLATWLCGQVFAPMYAELLSRAPTISLEVVHPRVVWVDAETGQAKGGAEPKTQAEQKAQLEEILGLTDANKAVKDLGTVTEMRF